MRHSTNFCQPMRRRRSKRLDIHALHQDENIIQYLADSVCIEQSEYLSFCSGCCIIKGNRHFVPFSFHLHRINFEVAGCTLRICSFISRYVLVVEGLLLVKIHGPQCSKFSTFSLGIEADLFLLSKIVDTKVFVMCLLRLETCLVCIDISILAFESIFIAF